MLGWFSYSADASPLASRSCSSATSLLPLQLLQLQTQLRPPPSSDHRKRVSTLLWRDISMLFLSTNWVKKLQNWNQEIFFPLFGTGARYGEFSCGLPPAAVIRLVPSLNEKDGRAKVAGYLSVYEPRGPLLHYLLMKSNRERSKLQHNLAQTWTRNKRRR